MGFSDLFPLQDFTDVSLGANLHRWLRNFDHDFYRHHKHSEGIADLAGMSDGELVTHFVQRGCLEGRMYNRFIHSFIDPNFYAQRYPELRLNHPWQAKQHWMYYGAYEGRIPNSTTQELADAKIHLFQMGKVASKSIEAAITAAGYRVLIPHLHWANELMFSYPDCFYPYDELINLDREKKLFFISGVRDPIERVISGLFQSSADPKSNVPIEGLIASLKQDGDSKGNVTIFLYRLDALHECWDPLSELLDFRLVPVVKNNSEGKVYGEQYQELLSDVRSEQDEDLVQEITASAYWNHFFKD